MDFSQAQNAIVAACTPVDHQNIALGDAVERILARDVVATEDLVPFARSSMDGYAVRSADLSSAPVRLQIAAAVYAAPGARRHAPHTATAIATGAAIPAGADCVLPFEDVDVHDGVLIITRAVRAGSCIFPAGEDAQRGDVLLARGAVLGPASIALLAAAGATHVDVYRRPRVAIICGGDELVNFDETPAYGEIRDSNALMLTTALVASGALVIPPVRLNDKREALSAALETALGKADLVVTTGGASVGERDFVKRACVDIGIAFVFTSVGLRPAKPTGFGQRGNQSIAVLPGNPAAAFVAYHEFVAPAVRVMAGRLDPYLPRVPARLAGTINAKAGRHFAAFAAVTVDELGMTARPLENQCSSLTRTAARGAGLIIVPPGPGTYGAGDRVWVDIFDWTQVQTPAGRRTADAPAPAEPDTLLVR